MVDFPAVPFLTEDFSPKGKGIDYLGMRNVNLVFLESELIPGINNATRDLGTYLLGVWITWKFIGLCQDGIYNYTRNNFKKFSEAIEIAISHATRDDSKVNGKYPLPRNRIGRLQEIDLSRPVTFENMGRGESASIFNPAQYGPSLRWIGLTSDALSEDGRSAGFPMALSDDDTKVICEHVEKKLNQSPYFHKVLQGDKSRLNLEEIDSLGLAGLCAGAYRSPSGVLKKSLESKLFPAGSKRKDTADLVIATVQKHGPFAEEELRRVWYTGLTPDGATLTLDSSKIQHHAKQWGIFYSRQIIRYALETLLCCLERAVNRGSRSIREAVDTLLLEWMENLDNHTIGSFGELLIFQCQSAGIGIGEATKLAIEWSKKIGPAHEHFELVDFQDGPEMFAGAMKMVGGWWMRISGRPELEMLLDHLPDESGRVPMKELHGWLLNRMDDDFIDTCRDLMAEFVYSQHLRIGMSRLGNDGTRLRFSLGDEGITPTAKVDNFAKAKPPMMADRLHAIINLMEDLDYVHRKGEHISTV